jgi:opacity protein-like surface antigen
MKRSLVCASLVGFLATPAWAAADLPSSDPTGSSVATPTDDSADANARGGKGGGSGRGSNGGGGGSKSGGSRGDGAGAKGGQHDGGKGNGSSHAAPPRSGDKPSASRNGSRESVSNHPSHRASSKPSSHAPSRGVAKKTVHRGSPPRATHKATARVIHKAKPSNHHAVIFPRWRPTYHRYYLGRHTPAHWAHGVFIYSPPPARRVVVIDGHRRVVQAGTSDALRAVDRNGDLGIGITTGSYMSTYRGGEGSYGDFGLGLSLSYRPVEALGLEVAWSHHSESWESDSERESDPLSASAKLYAMPWTRVSPYLTLGVTATQREFDDTYSDGFRTQTATVDDTLVGPHVGLGIEFAVGKSAALDFEGRLIGYTNKDPADPAAPVAGQATGGLKFYF